MIAIPTTQSCPTLERERSLNHGLMGEESRQADFQVGGKKGKKEIAATSCQYSDAEKVLARFVRFPNPLRK